MDVEPIYTFRAHRCVSSLKVKNSSLAGFVEKPDEQPPCFPAVGLFCP